MRRIAPRLFLAARLPMVTVWVLAVAASSVVTGLPVYGLLGVLRTGSDPFLSATVDLSQFLVALGIGLLVNVIVGAVIFGTIKFLVRRSARRPGWERPAVSAR